MSGGVILYPTDTVWGIGCDATNDAAVERIVQLKRRLDSKGLLVLVDTAARIQSYVDVVPEIAWDLIELSDTPLTIIYPHAKNLAKGVMGADKSVGIRVTVEAFSNAICARLRRPIVSTSANISGTPTPLAFNQISSEIIHAVDYVVDFRQSDATKLSPSSIIKLKDGNVFEIIR